MPTLNWIGKEAVVNHHHQVPFHLLKDVPELAAGDPGSGNLIVQGDNLIALKALLPYYAGQVKCIYIDPPYNTGNEGWIYNDNVNSPLIREWLGKAVGKEAEDLSRHDKWLCMMYSRLQLLKLFLKRDGVIFVQIDDKEVANLRMICDEIFGASQFLNMIVVKTSDPSGHKTVNPSPYSQTEYVLMYCIDRNQYKYEQRYVESAYDPGYNRVILNKEADYQSWQVGNINELVAKELKYPDTRSARKALGKMSFDAIVAAFALKNRDRVFQPTAISDAAGKKIVDAREGSKNEPTKVFRVERADYEDVYILGGRQIYFYSSKVRQIEGEFVPAKPLTNLWTDVPWNGISGEGGVEFKNGKKPLRLVKRCIEMVTQNGDIILDSFAGSGTTGEAVLQQTKEDGKKRNFILVEIETRIAQEVTQRRLSNVVNGFDGEAGLGGGFRFCELGEPLFDEHGQIKPSVRFADLARHVYFTETGEPLPRERVLKSPLIGECRGVGIYLLFNGILGDKSANGGNILTRGVLAQLPKFDGQKVIYCAGCLLGKDRLHAERIIVRQTPYEIKVS